MKTSFWSALIVAGALQWLAFLGLDQLLQLLRQLVADVPLRLGWFPFSAFLLSLLAAALVFWMLGLLGRSLHWLGFRRAGAGEWSLVLGFLAFSFPVALLGRVLVPEFDVWYARNAGLLTWPGVGLFFVLLIFTVAKEELLQRSMQRLLLEYVPGFMVSMVIAVQFAFAHYFTPAHYGIASAISVGCVAFLLALLYTWTKDIWLTLVFHFVFNVIITLQIFLHASGDVVGEILLWLVWGIAWLFSWKPIWHKVRSSLPRLRLGMSWLQLVALLCFATVLPALYIFVFR